MDISLFTTTESVSIIDVMKKIDSNGSGIVFIVDKDGKLMGTLTDGDIRKVLIRTGSINCELRDIMNRNPRYLPINRRKDAINFMIKNRVRVIPLVDDELRIVDVAINSYSENGKNHSQETLKDTPVIIMAGGKGTRLYPYTKILPKPLIPIGDVPIVERILDRFTQYGVSDFYMTVNYRKEMIKSYFSEKDSYSIVYIEEDMPLGTAGAIRLIDREFTSPIIITNCDILIEADYDKIMEYHVKSRNDITVVSSLKVTTIPYGVLKTKQDGIIDSLEEKPTISHFINTGMYVLNPPEVKNIPKNKPFDMTTLMEKMITDGKRVGMYPISEDSFLDMGEFAEMKRMEERINSGYMQE